MENNHFLLDELCAIYDGFILNLIWLKLFINTKRNQSISDNDVTNSIVSKRNI